MLILIVVCLWDLYVDTSKDSQPTAMDVYQGKTTLEYAIRDSIKIDSIVVFKDSLIIN
jgi:hypothetical protein